MSARQSYRFSITGHTPSLSVRAFSATESANAAYRVEITATSPDSLLPLASYINRRAAFEIRPRAAPAAVFAAAVSGADGLPAKQWQGIVTSCEKLSVSPDETVYRFVLEPRFAALKHFTSSRLFQHQTVPEIIASVLAHHGFSGVEYRFCKSRSYPVREYVTQYQESDFDFVNRLCEEEGIWYAFEQDTQYGDVVLFGDSPEHYLRVKKQPVPYRPHAGLESSGEEAVFSLGIRHNPVPESVRSADYNYRDADTGLSAEAVNPKPTEGSQNTEAPALLGRQQHWGLHPKTPGEAAVQTAVLNEAHLCRQTVASGSGNVLFPVPMGVFCTDTVFPEAPEGWLVVSITHSGSRDSAYANRFTAIPAGRSYRPQRTTPAPKIHGTLPARITAAENCTYAYIDDMGRYRVKLPFDLDQWSPGGESRPVRLAKPYAGGGYGIHFPLHEGTEVMLSFVQGNPDRPYISGVMHDSSRPDHIPAGWNTRNVIRTWANNKLRMEDQQGREHIKLATPHSQSQLNLGHLVDSGREKRGGNGEGFELRTDGWGALRAGRGLLVSTHIQTPGGKVLDMDDAISQLEQALSLAESLSRAAQAANNRATNESGGTGRLKDALSDLKEAGLIQAAPAGIASATEQSQLHSANQNIHLVSGSNTDLSAGRHLTAHAQESLNLFARNGAIKLQAGGGDVTVQAQNGLMRLNALKDATLSSSGGKVTIAAEEEILITCKGAYIKLSNGEIEIGGPKILRVKSPLNVSGAAALNHFIQPMGSTEPTWLSFQYLDSGGRPMPFLKYKALFQTGQTISGTTDADGFCRIENPPSDIIELLIDEEPAQLQDEDFQNNPAPEGELE